MTRTSQTRIQPSSSSLEDAESSTAKLPPHNELWDRPGYLVRRLHQIHVALFLEECSEDNVTPVQYGLLSILASRPAMDQITLATELGIDRTNVADVLGRLAERGLVLRKHSDMDRRIRLAAITDKGRRLVMKNNEAMKRAQRRLLDPLPAASRRQFMTLLRDLVDANDVHSRAPTKMRGD